MRLIDADTLFDIKPEAMETIIFAGERSGKTYAIYESLFRKMVNNSPTVDAVPVVRCRECINNENGRCLFRCFALDENGFCHLGERK